jgi:hypothetical protein
MNKPLVSACALVAILASACASAAPTALPPTAPPPTHAPTQAPTPSLTQAPSHSAIPTPSQAPGIEPLPSDGPLSAGTFLYDYPQFAPVAFSLTFPEGWTVENGGWNVFSADLPSEVGFASSNVDTIYADACTGMDGEVVDAGSTVDDLVNALLAQAGPAVAVEGPSEVTLGGYSGQRVDITAPAAAEVEGCAVPGLQLWRDEAGNWFVVLPDWQSSIYIVDVDGERLVLATQYPASAPAADLAELEAVIESIGFQL